MNNTLILSSESKDAIDLAAKLLGEGEVIGLPTETVYGLAANALNPAAVRRIFEVKGRPQDNPLIVHVADVSELSIICKDVPKEAIALTERFWPGALTVVLKRSEMVPSEVSAGLDTVAVRMPSHTAAIEVIKRCGFPLAAPSANRSGSPSPTTARHVFDDLGGLIPLIIDGGTCDVGVESTVLDMTGERLRLLRPGGLPLSELCEVLGDIEIDPSVTRKMEESFSASSPGMKYRHYAPKAPLTAVCGAPEESKEYILKEIAYGNCGVLCFDECASEFGNRGVPYGSFIDHKSLERGVFNALRRLDRRGYDRIFAQCPNMDGEFLAVYNRITKAAGFKIVKI